MYAKNTYHDFPTIPNQLKKKYPKYKLRLRHLGMHLDDLKMDFGELSLPHLITKILECFTEDKKNEKINSNFFWDLSISKRIEIILILAINGERSFKIKANCNNKKCKEEFEIDIPIKTINQKQKKADEINQVNLIYKKNKFELRKPIAKDQISWQNEFSTNKEFIVNVVKTLNKNNNFIHSKIISDNFIKEFNKIMENIDPLINFTVIAKCPYCDVEDKHTINLEKIALKKLKQNQENLLESIHKLASNYHWNEKQIFSIPTWRRAKYLSMIRGN